MEKSIVFLSNVALSLAWFSMPLITPPRPLFLLMMMLRLLWILRSPWVIWTLVFLVSPGLRLIWFHMLLFFLFGILFLTSLIFFLSLLLLTFQSLLLGLFLCLLLLIILGIHTKWLKVLSLPFLPLFLLLFGYVGIKRFSVLFDPEFLIIANAYFYHSITCKLLFWWRELWNIWMLQKFLYSRPFTRVELKTFPNHVKCDIISPCKELPEALLWTKLNIAKDVFGKFRLNCKDILLCGSA